MKQYQVSANGIDFGFFEADSAAHALDLYAQMEGYASYSDIVAEWGDETTAVEVAA